MKPSVAQYLFQIRLSKHLFLFNQHLLRIDFYCSLQTSVFFCRSLLRCRMSKVAVFCSKCRFIQSSTHATGCRFLVILELALSRKHNQNMVLFWFFFCCLFLSVFFKNLFSCFLSRISLNVVFMIKNI